MCTLSTNVPKSAQPLEQISDRYGISAIYVFGSRAKEIAEQVKGKNAQTIFPHSDIDIGVQLRGGQRLSARAKVNLTIELEDLLAVPRVDLMILAEANPFLAMDIICGELLYCLDPDEQAREELYILRREGDMAYFERQRIRKILREESA